MTPATRKTVLIAVLVAVLLPLAGCAALTGEEGPEDDPNGPDVDEEALRSSSLEAMESVETVRVETNMTTQIDGETLYAIQSDGVMDTEAQRAHITTSSSSGGTEFDSEQYLIGETLYMHSETLGGWVKQNLSTTNAWGPGDLVQQQEMLEEADLEVTGRTATDGQEVYVAELEIDGGVMSDIAAQQTEDSEIGQIQQSMSFQNATVTQHIDVETNRVRYSRVEYGFSVNGEETTMVVEQRFSEFNEPVEIELPEEAANADPIGDSFDV